MSQPPASRPRARAIATAVLALTVVALLGAAWLARRGAGHADALAGSASSAPVTARHFRAEPLLPATPDLPTSSRVDPPPWSAELAADGAPGADEVRALVARGLADELAGALPDRRFTPAELERMTDLLLELRAARLALSRLPHAPDTAAERARVQGALGEAVARFSDVAGMSPQELTDRLQAGVGLTQPGSENDAPVLELLPPEP